MADAVADVPENGKLVIDTDVTEPVTIDKPMTVDGGGKSVDSIVVNDAEVTVDNVTVNTVTVTGTKSFTLTNSTVNGTEDNLSIDTTGKITLSGNTFTGV